MCTGITDKHQPSLQYCKAINSRYNLILICFLFSLAVNRNAIRKNITMKIKMFIVKTSLMSVNAIEQHKGQTYADNGNLHC